MPKGGKSVVLDQEGIAVVGGGPNPCPHLGKPVGEVVPDGKGGSLDPGPFLLEHRSRMLALVGARQQRGNGWVERGRRATSGALLGPPSGWGRSMPNCPAKWPKIGVSEPSRADAAPGLS